MSDIVPFGKHKGKPVEALLDDRPYLDWLLSQSWFKEKFGNVYNIVINAGQEPSETPEHNAMQIRFLEGEYRLKFAYLFYGDKLFEYCDLGKLKADLSRWAPSKNTPGSKFPLLHFHDLDFEKNGIDVHFDLSVGYDFNKDKEYYHPYADDYCNINRTRYCEFNIEIKPSIGDDYPAVLRQIQRNKSKYLLVRAYNGAGATKEQFVQFFASQGIKVVFEADVDAVVFPLFDRELAL